MKSILLFLAVIVQPIFGATLLWDPNNPAEEVTGYNVFAGRQSRQYTTNFAVSPTNWFKLNGTNVITNGTNVCSFVLPKMRPGIAYFAVTATNDYGVSDYSAEVIWTNKWLSTPAVSVVVNSGLISWTRNPTNEKVTNYAVTVTSSTWGTNLLVNRGTNSSFSVRSMTNGAWMISVKAESAESESKPGAARVVNVPLYVPSGKFNISASSNLVSWQQVATVDGPVVMWFYASNSIGFFRYQPAFTVAASSKGGATDLLKKSTTLSASAPQRVEVYGPPTSTNTTTAAGTSTGLTLPKALTPERVLPLF